MHSLFVIRLYPVVTETLVLTHDSKVVLDRISDVLDQPFVDQSVTKVMTGWVQGDSFQICLRMRRHQFFIPVIDGKVEPTSKGSLVFIRYSYFSGTRALLTFWTIVLPLIGFPLSQQRENMWILAGLLLFVVAMHVVALQSFHYHIGIARAAVHKLLS